MIVTVTRTVTSPPTGRTPSGSARPTSWTTFVVAPVDRDRLRSRLRQVDQLIGFPLDRDDEGIDGDRGDLVAGGGCAVERGRDGQRAAAEDVEHLDSDVGRGRLDVDRRHPITERVDGNEIDVAIDVEAARLDGDVRLDLGDPIDDRSGALRS